MIYTGIVSITFRKLKPREIIDLTVKAGLDGIEWGGDTHVPHGDIKKAVEVRKMTHDEGIKIASYGSYYRVGQVNNNDISFDRILETAIALQSPTIRVWAGNKGSLEADEAWWSNVIEDTKKISGSAKEVNKTISFEYHNNTLTDTWESSVRLMKEVSEENVNMYWQPNSKYSLDENIVGLENILYWLSNVHAFYSGANGLLSFSEGIDVWEKYIDVIEKAEHDRYCMLEFVKNDSTEQFLLDASSLKKIVNKIV